MNEREIGKEFLEVSEKEFELKERLNRMHLLNMFFMCGGKISFWKNVKLIANLLSIEKEKPYLDYFWSDQFFGPYNRSFSLDLEFLIENDFLNRKIISPQKSGEPIFHNEYVLADDGKEEAIKSIEEEAKADLDYILTVIGKCLSYNLLSPGGNLCLIFEKFPIKRSTYLPNSMSIFRLSQRVRKDLAKNLIDSLPKDIEVSHKYDEKERAYVLEIGIQPSFARKRNSYLKISEKDISNYENDYKNFCSLPKKKAFIAEKIGVKKLEILDMFPKAVEKVEMEWEDNIRTLKSIDNPNKYWESIMKSIEKLYSITIKTPFEIKIPESSNIMLLDPREPLRKYIDKKGGFGCYDELWSVIQPSELITELTGKKTTFSIKEVPHVV